MTLLDMMIETPFQAFIKKLKTGWKGDCECCGRWSQIYRRKIHHSVAAWLIRLYKAGGDKDFIEVVNLRIPGMTASSDYCIAKFWNLIEQKTNTDEDKRSSGYWKLTARGVDFVRGLEDIPQVALVFDDQVIGFDGKQQFIQQCLGDKFKYPELMAA